MSEQSHSSRSEPGELGHVKAFVNSRDVGGGVERFDTPEALRDWFAERGWLSPGATLSDPDLRQAREVRESLRSLLLTNNGHPLDESAVDTLNAAAKSAEMLVWFHPSGTGELAPARSGIDGALGHLLAIVFRSMAEGTWPRLKACPEHSCLYAFYDHSKNRSGTWCDMAVCGNRAKARAYRERRAKQRGG
jgi:predicted RNA-binding Zn ribbon-like protein